MLAITNVFVLENWSKMQQTDSSNKWRIMNGREHRYPMKGEQMRYADRSDAQGPAAAAAAILSVISLPAQPIIVP